jgi:hypothetical protein
MTTLILFIFLKQNNKKSYVNHKILLDQV